ncbi:hypothetical protein K1T71_004030 [Dendrolimus kikuchii]|uniref:Uncharacterized protein n=1 Tax=Dendrolimus kikuchii TaxID=765133 RepID=A0ACC1D9P6_9NEOP|nr:hypothetical protein K1T71_004030 [Dendrolimus kikuchii]
MCKLISLLLTVFLFDISYTQRNVKFFRKDYHYLDDLQSFYKIHNAVKTWENAKKTCKLEGASLFYPVNEAEANSVITFWNKTQPHNWVFIGVSARFAKGSFATIEGKPIDDVYNKWAPWEPNDAGGVEDCVVLSKLDGTLNDDNCDKKLNFICKKTLVSLEWHDKCSLPDTNYIYNDDLSKCYKLHLTPMNWSEAYSICSNEQSYLAILNNQFEADYLSKLVENAPKDNILQPYLAGAVHLGFQNLNGEGWTTIKDTTLEEAGYTRWGNQQPDGGDNERCGSMFYEGTLNDIACNQKCIFICEHEAEDGINERFGETQ